MKKFLNKLTSRKFIASVAGFVGGIVLVCNGGVTEGAAAIIASVLGYLAAEGMVDAKAVLAESVEIVTAEDDIDDYVGCTE